MASNVVKLGTNGRVVIPAEVRKTLGVSTGDTLLITVQDGELRMRTAAAAIARAQEIVRRHIPDGHSLSEELIRERHEEASGES
jgi:AbrB family looped-hinge helix DNA binding protein